MEKIISVLTNNIVVIWVAPIITGIVVAVILKLFSIKKTKKEIKRANQEYKEAILPYVLQGITLTEKVIHGIRDAICIEMSISKKHMYSDADLMNILIYDITRTRYSTEEGKNLLIEHICKMFSFNSTEFVGEEKAKDNFSSRLAALLGAGIGSLCLIGTIIIYSIKPEAVDDPNGTAATIIIVFMAIAMVCFAVVFFNVMGDKADFAYDGILGSINDMAKDLTYIIHRIVFGTKRKEDTKTNESDDL